MDDTYRILLPTDFSDTADHALNIGVALSKRSYSQIHLLHIEDIPEDWVKLAENSESSLFSSAQKQLAEVKNELSNRVKLAEDNGAEVKSFLKYNKSYRAILEHIKKNRINLIVMGAHGRTGLKGQLIGSYTEKILHHATIPVLVTKYNDVVNDFRTMVFVSDFDPKYSASFPTVLEAAQKARAALDVLFINTPNTFLETKTIHKRIDKYISSVPKGMITKIDIVNAYRFEVGLAEYCQQQDIDIIAMPIHHKRHSWEVLGSTIEDVMYHISLPTLGIPGHKKH